METISVVVPVYNVEKYLSRCIDSIIKQTYKNLEIILVNDGSTDSSYKICEEYKKNDDRIIVIHKQNGGLSSARNTGIEKASGKYIGFIDSDDCISYDMFEHLYSNIKRYDCDIASIKSINVKAGKNVNLKRESNEIIKLDNRKEILSDYLKEASYSCCTNLYKKELFKEIKFPEGKINEDIATNFKILTKVNSIVKSKKVCYFYYTNEGSITNRAFNKKDYDLKEVSNELYELAKKQNYSELEYLAEVKLKRVDFSLLCKIAMYGIDERMNKEFEINQLLNTLRSNFYFLIKSPMSFSRKVALIFICINFNLFEKIIILYKIITKGGMDE